MTEEKKNPEMTETPEVPETEAPETAEETAAEDAGKKESCLYGPDSAPAVGGDL